MPAPFSVPKNTQYAKFATTSRLISCLVMETLVAAYYIPCGDTPVCLLVRPNCQVNLSVNLPAPRIELIDPMDMLPHIYSISMQETQTISTTDVLCEKVYNALCVLKEDFSFSANYAYDHPKPLPTLASSSVQWEQSVLEGHATHPMHKARRSYPPMPPLNPNKVNLEHPLLRLVCLPRSSLKIRGEFESLSAPIVDCILNKTPGKTAMQCLIPIHELQLPNLSKFPEAIVLPAVNSVTIESLTSLRSVAVPEVLPGLSIKLALGVKISSALRTITPFSTHFGPGFSFEVVPKLTYDHNVLTVQRELGSVVHKNENFDISKHCSCVLREAAEFDKVIIQRPDTDTTLVTHVWQLDSDDKIVAFLDRYIRLALEAFLPPCLVNGTGLLQGFVIRDFGGIKVHKETLKATTGVNISVLPESCVVADSLEEVYKLLYHTLIHSHLQRLIRVLGMHYDGRGWAILLFMETKKVPGKYYIYCPVPNVIHYQPQTVEDVVLKTV
ncbi:hypothetical protein BDF14DRAFT_1872144 [Spinellus fusiger]|nr:hypothetical protein BDF14DRAFT_1872144 [Spinellus fusiger]